MRIFLLILVATSLAAEHDHSIHLDTSFISGEARRVGWLSLAGIEKAINDYIDALKIYETKYEQFFASPREGEEENVRSIWQNKFEKNYRGTVDRLLIAVDVCRDVYARPNCEISEGIDFKLDTRGEQFRQDFLNEIHKAIQDQVSVVKRSRKDL